MSLPTSLGLHGPGTEQESTPSSKWEDIQVGGGNCGNDSLMSTALSSFFKYMIQRISSLDIPDQWGISELWIYSYPRGENNGRQDGNKKWPFKVSRPKCKQLRGYGGRGGSVPSLQEKRLWLDRGWGNQMQETKDLECWASRDASDECDTGARGRRWIPSLLVHSKSQEGTEVECKTKRRDFKSFVSRAMP